MNCNLYDRIVTSLGATIACAVDAPLDEGYVLTVPVVVVSQISDTPTTSIDGTIALRDKRITCEVQALDITAARDVKEALIDALQCFRAGDIKACVFENGGPELYESDLNPPRFILPVDFMLTF